MSIAMAEDKVAIGIIMSTTRNGRFADIPAQWIQDLVQSQTRLEAQIIDLRDYPLPFFDEALSPALAPPQAENAQYWNSRIASLDGYVFITAEYNHGYPAVLKNALDHSYREFARKPAAFLGYGGLGAARAIEQLRLVTIELQMAPIRAAVHIGMEAYLGVVRQRNRLDDFGFLKEGALQMLDELAWWVHALKAARQ
jgi:NAD(P)H-dependent FMN reductase